MRLPQAALIINVSDSFSPAQSSKYDAKISSLTLVLLSKIGQAKNPSLPSGDVAHHRLTPLAG